MRLGCLVRRRFVDRGSRVVAEAVRPVELALPPASGQCLVLPDGVEVLVSQVRVRIGLSTGLGVQPVELECLGCKEPVARLAAALASGWRRVGEADEPAAVALFS